MSKPIFIGIDPAARCGVSYSYNDFCKCDILKLTAKAKNGDRKFAELVSYLHQFSVCQQPKELFFENYTPIGVFVFLEKRIQFGIRGGIQTEAPLSEIRGAVEALCTLYGFHLHRIGIQDLKKFFTANSNAAKESMILAAQKNGYEGQDPDEADAFLLMLYGKHLYQNGLLQAPKDLKKKRVPRVRRKSV